MEGIWATADRTLCLTQSIVENCLEGAPREGILNVQVYGPICPIANMSAPGNNEFVLLHRYWLQNEHCQNLNIRTQSLDRNAKKSILVWMDGGLS